jgi:hypothetical protein
MNENIKRDIAFICSFGLLPWCGQNGLLGFVCNCQLYIGLLLGQVYWPFGGGGRGIAEIFWPFLGQKYWSSMFENWNLDYLAQFACTDDIPPLDY